MNELVKVVLSVLVTLAFVLALLALLAFAVNACVNDARRRGKSPLLVTIAAILFFPWGLIAWLLFRPEPLDPRRTFRLQDHRVQ